MKIVVFGAEQRVGAWEGSPVCVDCAPTQEVLDAISQVPAVTVSCSVAVPALESAGSR